MKFYSETLNKMFDSAEALEKAEVKHTEEEKKRQQEFDEDIAHYEKIKEALRIAIEQSNKAEEEYGKMSRLIMEKYGEDVYEKYSLEYEDEDDDELVFKYGDFKNVIHFIKELLECE